MLTIHQNIHMDIDKVLDETARKKILFCDIKNKMKNLKTITCMKLWSKNKANINKSAKNNERYYIHFFFIVSLTSCTVNLFIFSQRSIEIRGRLIIIHMIHWFFPDITPQKEIVNLTCLGVCHCIEQKWVQYVV